MQSERQALEHIITLTILPTWELLILSINTKRGPGDAYNNYIANVITACELITVIRKRLFVLKGKVTCLVGFKEKQQQKRQK